MTDANQRWDVGQAIEWMRAAQRTIDPYWIEEPTSPDDVLGHAAIARALAPMRVATGEHAHNRVMFKQLLQADAISVLPGRRVPPRRRQRGARGAADGRHRAASRRARTWEASGCASTCRTSRRSTTSRSRAHSTGACASGPITCTSTSSGRSRWPAVGIACPTPAGLRRDDAARFPRALSVPRRPVWRPRRP